VRGRARAAAASTLLAAMAGAVAFAVGGAPGVAGAGALPASTVAQQVGTAGVGTVDAAAGPGYWLLREDGNVSAFGGAAFHGSMGSQPLSQPTICMSSTTDGQGYWLLASDGGVFSFGDASFFGSTGGINLNQPVVGMAAAANGKGYWLVASDGGVFSFGTARFHGSMGGVALNEPVVGMAATPDGKGYWLVASDGGVFSFGTARFYGSTGAIRLNEPVVGMAATPDGKGYWLVASDGGVFSFGDAKFYGSTGGVRLASPIVGMTSAPGGHGYWLAAQDGGVFTFGHATFYGSLGGTALSAPVVAVAATGRPGGCQGTAVPGALRSPGAGGPPGEGQWVPAGRLVGSTPAVYSTTLRPFVGGAADAVAWVDTSRADVRLYAGPPSQPPGSYAASGAVAPGDRGRLLAAFNSGFMVAQSDGGWYSEGQMPYPLVNGAASLVSYANGSVRVGMWGRDFTLTPNVVSVRQNLTLLVDRGQPAGNINVGADWGAVIGGVGNTWRSGVGVDRYGHLIYVAGPDLFPADLAHLLIEAGAVEAMEMDINPMWPVFATYITAPGQSNPLVVAGSDILPGMALGPATFITSWDRDFFAVLTR
jgi:hypothetical protein